MKHLLLALLVLAVAPTVEAQYESAYYGLSLGEFDYEAQAAWAVADTYELLSTHGRLSVHGAPRRRRRLGRDGTIRDSVRFGLSALPANFHSEFEILTIRLLGVLPFDNGVVAARRPRLRRFRGRRSRSSMRTIPATALGSRSAATIRRTTSRPNTTGIVLRCVSVTRSTTSTAISTSSRRA